MPESGARFIGDFVRLHNLYFEGDKSACVVAAERFGVSPTEVEDWFKILRWGFLIDLLFFFGNKEAEKWPAAFLSVMRADPSFSNLAAAIERELGATARRLNSAIEEADPSSPEAKQTEPAPELGHAGQQ